MKKEGLLFAHHNLKSMYLKANEMEEGFLEYILGKESHSHMADKLAVCHQRYC